MMENKKRYISKACIVCGVKKLILLNMHEVYCDACHAKYSIRLLPKEKRKKVNHE